MAPNTKENLPRLSQSNFTKETILCATINNWIAYYLEPIGPTRWQDGSPIYAVFLLPPVPISPNMHNFWLLDGSIHRQETLLATTQFPQLCLALDYA